MGNTRSDLRQARNPVTPIHALMARPPNVIYVDNSPSEALKRLLEKKAARSSPATPTEQDQRTGHVRETARETDNLSPVTPIHRVWRVPEVNSSSEALKRLLEKKAARSSPATPTEQDQRTGHVRETARETDNLSPVTPIHRVWRVPEVNSSSEALKRLLEKKAARSSPATPTEQDQRTGHVRETARETDNLSPVTPIHHVWWASEVNSSSDQRIGHVRETARETDNPSPASTSFPPSPSPSPESKAPSLNPVPCNYCPSTTPLPAVKTCLVCGASMCHDHMRPHLESPVFRSHTLVPPVEDISPWRCGEHQEMTRIDCSPCDTCVCTARTAIGSHHEHACVGITEAERELRENLKDQMTHLQDTEQALVSRVSELTDRKRASQLVLKEARAGVQQQYSAMRELLEQEEQQALLCVSQEESRAVGSLDGPLSLLQDSLAFVQQGLHALEGLADATGAERMQDQALIAEYSKVIQSVSERQCGVEELKAPEEVNQARLTSLQQWTKRRLDSVVVSLPDRDSFRLLYGIRPSLDPDTAHLKLLLSEENRMVVYTEALHDYPEQGARFTGFPQVLASQSLEEGRWYWEVEIPWELGHWKVGVCEARIARKGLRDNCCIGFNPCSWCLVSDKGKLEVLHDKVVVPVSADELCKVGVFLDFEGGSLSFYRVAQGGAITLLHSFQQRFTEPLYPALAVSRTRLVISDLFHTPASD